MKKRITITLIVLLLIVLSGKIYANENITNIKLDSSKITVNGKNISTNSNDEVYFSSKTDNGLKTKEAIDANIDISNIINITESGKYEFSGELNDCQIAINANKILGEVEIILNNVNITCEKAPAILVFCNDITEEKCKVKITSAKNSVNKIIGGRLKQDIMKWEDIEGLQYYILEGYDEEKREEYKEYKYNGAISSDISLIFDGEGILNVVSNVKEGIETKLNVTFNGGKYNITAMDDAINTILDNTSSVTINDGFIILNPFESAKEGDGIDSNGYIYINGGTLFAFSYADADDGLDANYSTYIQGGTVLSIGDKSEMVDSKNGRNILHKSFRNEVEKGEKIVVLDEKGDVIFAFKTDRNIKTFTYSSEDLNYNSYKVYTGEKIPKNLSYTLLDFNKEYRAKDEEIDFDDINYIKIEREEEKKVLLIISLIIIIIYFYMMKKIKAEKGEKNEK